MMVGVTFHVSRFIGGQVGVCARVWVWGQGDKAGGKGRL